MRDSRRRAHRQVVILRAAKYLRDRGRIFRCAQNHHAAPAVILLAPLLLWLGGCGGTITPPPHVRDPTQVYVTDYGRHSTLLLPSGNGSGLVEYAFGDRAWLVGYHRKWYNAFGSLFFSDGATLGRRYFREAPPPERFVQALQAGSYLTFAVEKERAAELRRRLDAEWERAASTASLAPDNDGFLYVDDTEGYSLLHNCNHVTARWLRELGCEVSGATMTSKFKLK
jgi:hypothetical protein